MPLKSVTSPRIPPPDSGNPSPSAYLLSEPAQQIFAEEGFRPTNQAIWNRVKARFAPAKRFFSVSEFGGWTKVDATFFAKGGVWDRLVAKTR